MRVYGTCGADDCGQEPVDKFLSGEDLRQGKYVLHPIQTFHHQSFILAPVVLTSFLDWGGIADSTKSKIWAREVDDLDTLRS